MSTPYFGIDFGTTNSSMAWCDPESGEAETILNAEGEDKTPSLVYYGEDEILVGKYAVEKLDEYQKTGDPEERDEANQRVVKSIKRNLINPPIIPIPARKPVRPVEVVAEVLKKLKHDAQEWHFGEEIERVVITYPALLGPQEQEVLLEAAATVGFRRPELFWEPAAAAIAFARQGQKVGDGVLVYDLGAGTFDLSVVVREDDGTFRVAMEPEGDAKCGGDDFDHALYSHCDEIAQDKLGRSISLTGEVDQFFLKQCHDRKHSLTRSKKSRFSSLLPSENGTQQFVHEVNQETFEGLIRGRIEGTVRKTVELRERAGSRGHEVDTLVLIGGSSQVPLVERLLREALPDLDLRKFAGKEIAVALGAAYRAYDLWGKVPREEEEYRRTMEVCWNDRWLTRTEVELLANLREQELELAPDTAARVEGKVMGDTIESVLERQDEVARDHYREVLELGWRDRKLDALRSIPRARLDMLLDNEEFFRNSNSPVSAAERKELLGDLPWPVFAMAARVAVDTTLSPAAVVDRLDAVADELGLTREQARNIERDVVEGLIGHGVELCDQGRHQDALELFDRATSLTPGSAKAWHKKGVTLAGLGRYDETLEAFEQVLEIDPDNAKAWNNKGAALSFLGRQDEALEAFEQALKLEPDYTQAQRGKRSILSSKLSKLRSELDTIDESFVEECVANVENLMASDSEWAKPEEKLNDCFVRAASSYEKKVREAARSEMSRVESALEATFSVDESGVGTEFSVQKNRSGKAIGTGASTGASIGLSIGSKVAGGWGALAGGALGGLAGGLGGTFFGKASKEKTLEAAEPHARELLPGLREEAEKYLDEVGKAVGDHGGKG